jgi:hypothetical protein
VVSGQMPGRGGTRSVPCGGAAKAPGMSKNPSSARGLEDAFIARTVSMAARHRPAVPFS